MDAFLNWLIAMTISACMLASLVLLTSRYTVRRLRGHSDRIVRDIDSQIAQEKQAAELRIAQIEDKIPRSDSVVSPPSARILPPPADQGIRILFVPERLAILKLIAFRRWTLTEIANTSRIEISRLRVHLRRLKQIGAIRIRRHGSEPVVELRSRRWKQIARKHLSASEIG